MIKKVKKVLIFIFRVVFLLYLFFSLTQVANAAGQYCCDSGFTYNPTGSSDLKPCKPSQGYVQPRAWHCAERENCIGLERGICTEDDILAKCCDSGFTYNPTDLSDPEPCKANNPQHSVPSRVWNCHHSQWCSPTGYCVVGQPPATASPLIEGFKPETCIYLDNYIDQDCINRGNTPAECTRDIEGIQTALGCFPTDPKEVISWVLKYSLILGGGIGFLLMVWGAFQIMTSAGDPEKLKAGQQILGSALAGIFLIIFSLFLLRLIGFTILKIPGFE